MSSAMIGQEEEDKTTVVGHSEILNLRRHTSEVLNCTWNPDFTDLIATGSADASARIRKMGGPKASDGCLSV